ncbi:guanylate cyclase [Ruegeria sediminis]|uniref:Guanylate cyclase n=1 Tax=Ruegeria sediminis TaxID=2583820 RepID=A0ABY2WYZ3_9RHOB|nr:adenylate/guanylate cyclase domain-containing protein [Ruegeria sediminis]TMV07821.1 guanylate cyclase [Ruegeria sediminis]
MDDTPHPSPELEAIAMRWARALISADGDTLANLLSDSDALLFCGTDDSERMEGNALRDAYAAHVREIPCGTILDCNVRAYETGNSGWSHWWGTIDFGNRGIPIPSRISLVFGMEKGIWKVQHINNSFSTSNLELLGYQHSALDNLLEAAREIDPQVAHADIASVMFTDIAGSSSVAAAVGDKTWTTAINRHLALLKELIAGHDGKLVKSLGDGTMSTFSSAGAAMSAACDIQGRLQAETDEPKLQVRIGIHTGDVMHSGDDFFGTVVNKAARIAALARPGEIRVSDATRIMVGGSPEFTFSDQARISLKGLEGEHLVYRLDRRN